MSASVAPPLVSSRRGAGADDVRSRRTGQSGASVVLSRSMAINWTYPDSLFSVPAPCMESQLTSDNVVAKVSGSRARYCAVAGGIIVELDESISSQGREITI